MRVILGSVLVGLLGALTACGGSSSGGGSSDPIVKGPQEQDCGDPIALVKTYERTIGIGVTSRQYGDVTDYVWANPRIEIAQNYGTASPSGTINVTDGSLIDACSWAQQAFGMAQEWTWEGGDLSLLDPDDSVYFTPTIAMSFNPPSLQTYAAWDNAGQPEKENAELNEAKLYVEITEIVNNDFWGRNHDTSVLNNTIALELNCEKPFELEYYIGKFNSLGNISPDVCVAELVDGATEYQCLMVTPIDEDVNACSFSSEKVFIPDNEGNYYEAKISGKTYATATDLYRIEINGVDILN